MNYNFGVKFLELTKARCMSLDLSQPKQLGENPIMILHVCLCNEGGDSTILKNVTCY